jgi:large subunit ribosomal protein L7/L12
MQSTASRMLSRYGARSLTARSLSDFRHAKSKDLFERITQQCTKEEIPILTDQIMKNLGRSFRQNEFYYRGFGGRRVKGGGGGGEAAEAAVAQEEKKSTVDVKLAAFDAKSKIKVIKEVRAIAGLGLKEAKELVESAPKVIMKEMKPEEAEELKKKLEELGATIELV